MMNLALGIDLGPSWGCGASGKNAWLGSKNKIFVEDNSIK